MRDAKPPFKFDFDRLITKARGQVNQKVDGISINLPFVSFNINPEDGEKQAAREIVIRMADRRVLNAWECCDNCIDRALESLQSIRSTLVDKQVQLSHVSDGTLYLLIEFMLEGIRQFLTFQERLELAGKTADLVHTSPNFKRSRDTREQYFAALEMLRAHLHRSLQQVSKIADMEIPRIADNMRYEEAWQLEAYKKPSVII